MIEDFRHWACNFLRRTGIPLDRPHARAHSEVCRDFTISPANQVHQHIIAGVLPFITSCPPTSPLSVIFRRELGCQNPFWPNLVHDSWNEDTQAENVSILRRLGSSGTPSVLLPLPSHLRPTPDSIILQQRMSKITPVACKRAFHIVFSKRKLISSGFRA